MSQMRQRVGASIWLGEEFFDETCIYNFYPTYTLSSHHV